MHEIALSVLDLEWARKKWRDSNVIMRLEQSPVGFWGNINKGAMCTTLATCLVQAQKETLGRDSEISRLQKEIQRLESENYRLRKEQDSEKKQTNKMFELLLVQMKPPLRAERDTAGSEEETEGGGSENSSNETELLEGTERLEQRLVRHVIKMEKRTGPRGRNAQTTIRSTPWTRSELNELQDRFSQRPGKTEMEYLWRVSLAGGDRILLNDDEAAGFWGPGVTLSDGPAGDHSVTTRVAYWAGGIHPKERGELITICVRGLSELAERVQKAACIQAMYKRTVQSASRCKGRSRASPTAFERAAGHFKNPRPGSQGKNSKGNRT